MVAAKRGNTAPPKKEVLDDKLSVKTRRELRKAYHTACRLLNTTMQDRINKHMLSTVEESGLNRMQPSP